jgi:hypothetical protein
MRKAEKSAFRNLTQLVSGLTDDQVLDLKEMACVRGGDGDGTPIIIPPPPVKI